MGEKILFIRSNPVNPDPRVEKEVESLSNAGYKVTILAWDRNGKYKIEEGYLNLKSGKVKIYRFGIPATYGGGIKNNLKPLILFQLRLAAWLFKNRTEYDIIHACDFDTAFISFKCAKMLRKKIIYDIFDYYVDAFTIPKKMKKIIVKLDHHIINSADGVIICTEKRVEQIKGSNPKKLIVLHNSPAKLNIEKKELKLNKEKIKIVYVGILAEGRFLRELATVISNDPDLELHIGGFGQLEEYFRRLALKHHNIIYYGKMPYRDTIKLENECDIMTAIYDPTIPNHRYIAPNKFYEALYLGKPIIMVENTGMDEVVTLNNIGQVIEYNCVGLKLGIQNLIKRKKEWINISDKMKRMYSEQYSWGEMEKRLINLYKEI